MNALVVISACICAVAGMPQYPYGYTGYPYAAVAPIVGPTTYDYNLIPDSAPIPAPLPAPYAVAPAVAPTEYKNQYHSQDEFGQYAYGHASLGQVHNAVRDFTGAVRGSYSYIDANNEEVIVHYIADHDGFRVSSNALPVAPTFDSAAPEAPEFNLVGPVFDLEPAVETPEVAAARAEHFRLVEEHKAAVAAALAAAEEAAATEEVVVEETTEAVVSEGDEEEVVVEAAEEVPEEVAEEGTVTEAAEAATELPAEEETAAEETAAEETAAEETAAEETAAEETDERRKRQVVNYFPQYYNALPVEPVVVKAEAPVVPVSQAVRDAELLRVVHNPGHAVSYRVD
ncbi:uncharacterized protein LOC135208577 [Macrobrachium nipponense]|uniref:uncharacterized protein LOC135208577 n=1 Tax=Macrobrachium nipponense TaxID=159736 RepID=UPI0030C7AB51